MLETVFRGKGMSIGYFNYVLHITQAILLGLYFSGLTKYKEQERWKTMYYVFAIFLLGCVFINQRWHRVGLYDVGLVLASMLYLRQMKLEQNKKKRYFLYFCCVVAVSFCAEFLYYERNIMEYSSHWHIFSSPYVNSGFLRLLIWGCAVLFVHRKQKKVQLQKEEWAILFLLLGMNGYAFFMEWQRNTQNGSLEWIGLLLLVAVMGIVLWLLKEMEASAKRRKQNELLLKAYETRVEISESMERLNRELHQMKHDFQKKLSYYDRLLKQNEWEKAKHLIEEDQSVLSNLHIPILNQNPVIMMLLNEMCIRAKKEGIAVKLLIMKQWQSIEDEYDLYIVLYNLLENAITYCGGERSIEIEMEENEEEKRVCIRNSIEESVLKDNPTLKTTNKDKRNHGYGLQNVKEIVAKHEWNFCYFEQGDMICFELKQSKEKA